MAKANLTAERLREVLHYDPKTGLFTRLQDSFAGEFYKVKMASSGDVVGSKTKTGYFEVSIDSRPYLLHRLAFLYMTGKWPACNVDHKDSNRINNIWVNLRPATQFQNMQNIKSAHADSSTGLLGISYCRSTNKWRAQIRSNGTKIHIGRYTTPEEAHAAYLQKKRELHDYGTI